MPYSGTGVYSPPAADFPAVTLTTIGSVHYNNVVTDQSTAMSNAVTRDGQSPWTANIPAGSFKITGLVAGSARTDSANVGNAQDAVVNWIAAGGTADVITAAYSPAVTALVDGQLAFFRASAANATTTPTFSPNGLTARTITKGGGAALLAGDITGNLTEVVLRYNLANTRWELVNPKIPVGSATTVIDAVGDLLVGTANDVAGRLAIGTARQVLRVNAAATTPVWDSQITLATEQASTAGTSIDFTGIPPGVRRITVMFSDVSTNGASSLHIQLGDAGGFEVAGYVGSVGGGTLFTTGFLLNIAGTGAAAAVFNGSVVLNLQNSTTFNWTVSGTIGRSDVSSTPTVAGHKALSQELSQVRISTAAGTDTFDAGQINISYE